MLLQELKNKLDSLSSNNDKILLLENYFQQHNHIEEHLLQLIYDPSVKFGVTVTEYRKQIKESESATNNANTLLLKEVNITDNYIQNTINILKYLANKQPNITKEIVQSLTYFNKRPEGITICWALQRYISKGTNIAIINKAYRKIYKRDLINTFSVALGMDATNRKLIELIPTNEHWLSSRKVDGQRTIYNSKNKIFYSRAGNEVSNLSNYVFSTVDDYVFDGEIAYVESSTNIESFKLTEMLIRRKDYKLPNIIWWSKKGEDEPTVEKTETNIYKFHLTYFIFDILTQGEFLNKESTINLKDRLARWENCNLTENNFMNLLSQTLITFNKQDNKYSIENEELPEGWEGYIIRKNCGYKGKRTKDMYKIKQFYDTEVECFDVEMTTKRMQNSDGSWTDRKCIGALLCKYNNTEVRVGSGLADYDRLKPKDAFINKLIKVKYTQTIKDKNNVVHLRHPVFICIRDANDL